MVAANADTPIVFGLSPGQAGDVPEGRKLLRVWGESDEPTFLIMDRAYEGDETRKLVEDLGRIPVVPPKSNRLEPWEYDRELYKRRNEVECSENSKGFADWLPDMTSWTPCFSPSWFLHPSFWL